MKKCLILSLIFLTGMLLTVQSTSAQASDKNKRQLYINGNGEVTDRGIKLGYISKEDIVFNNQGKKLGFIKNGKVYDADGNSMGKAKKGGKYYNNNGELVLYVKGNNEKCQILDPRGHSLGYLHKNYKLHACAAHCFFRENKILKDADAILEGYENIKNALVSDNSNSAQEEAQIFLNNSTALNTTSMKKTLENLSKTSSIIEQRKYFSSLSKELYTIFKDTGVDGKILYWIHCPTANEGIGAFWLSQSEEAQNPYLGAQMPECSSVKEVLK